MFHRSGVDCIVCPLSAVWWMCLTEFSKLEKIINKFLVEKNLKSEKWWKKLDVEDSFQNVQNGVKKFLSEVNLIGKMV